MAHPTIVVFGGTGFLGRRVVRHAAEKGFAVRVAARHPDRSREMFPAELSNLEFIRADVNDDRSIESAVDGAFGVVNAVSLYVERAGQTFRSVHVEAAARVARHAARGGVRRLAHLSGIGSDPGSDSPYIRSRGDGELAVRDAFPAATLIRPAVMFGPGDAFLTPIIGLLRRLPAFALFGRGRTRLQPAYVEDVAQAIVGALCQESATAITYEFGGPRIYSYAALIRLLADAIGRKPLLVPLPFALWHLLARAAEALPRPPITRNQVELMRADNVAAPGAPGFHAFRISPRSIEEELPLLIRQPA